MRCERAQELFSDYCEGTVQRALAVPLEDHLDTCPECRAQVEGLREVWHMLDEAPVVEPPPDFRAAVWRRIEADELARSQKPRLPRFSFRLNGLFCRPTMAWAAVLLLVVALAGVVIPGRYTTARMGFPWSVITRSDTAAVTLGQARIETVNGHSYLRVPVQVNSPGVDRLEAAIQGAEMPVQVVPVDERGMAMINLDAAGGPFPVNLRISWTQNGQKQAIAFSVVAH